MLSRYSACSSNRAFFFPEFDGPKRSSAVAAAAEAADEKRRERKGREPGTLRQEVIGFRLWGRRGRG